MGLAITMGTTQQKVFFSSRNSEDDVFVGVLRETTAEKYGPPSRRFWSACFVTVPLSLA
jgi:hypothetical protein